MRIRKHAKISPLLYAASSLNQGTVILQTHVCQLNQSPWDVMTFPSSDPETPPPPLAYKADIDDSYMVNGTSADCIATDESAPSIKFEVGAKINEWDQDIGVKILPAGRFGSGGTDMEEEDESNDGEIINLCCKSDGKGWKCRRKAKEGHSLCEHHSSSHQANKTSNRNSMGKKSEKTLDSRRRPRPRKTSTSSSSNPNEYYYYAGFGPRWGKKRGAATASIKAVSYTSSGGCDASRNDVKIVEKANTCQTNRNSNASTGAEEEKFPSSRYSSSQMDTEGLDYIEDEDDEDDDDDDDEEEYDEDSEIGQTEKKRARKPIKARSLKSLM